MQHSLVQRSLVKWYRQMLSIQFYQDPFQLPDKYCNFRFELEDKFINFFPSAFGRFISHHMGAEDSQT